MKKKYYFDLFPAILISLFFCTPALSLDQNVHGCREPVSAIGEKSFIGTFNPSLCSPFVPSSFFSGVIISVPAHDIIAGDQQRILLPVCGYYLVPVLAAMEGGPLTVHLRRVDSSLVLSGGVVEEGANEPLIQPPGVPAPSRSALEGVTMGRYFNIDAQRYLQHGLAPGAYLVKVSFAGMISNSVRIEVKASR